TILQRLTGEWAALLQPDAILTVCGEIGYARWRDCGFCRKFGFLRQNSKTRSQKFHGLQSSKFPKKQICDRTAKFPETHASSTRNRSRRAPCKPDSPGLSRKISTY